MRPPSGPQERGPLLELATHKNGSRVFTRDIGVKWPLTGTYTTTNKHWKCKKSCLQLCLLVFGYIDIPTMLQFSQNHKIQL